VEQIRGAWGVVEKYSSAIKQACQAVLRGSRCSCVHRRRRHRHLGQPPPIDSAGELDAVPGGKGASWGRTPEIRELSDMAARGRHHWLSGRRVASLLRLLSECNTDVEGWWSLGIVCRLRRHAPTGCQCRTYDMARSSKVKLDSPLSLGKPQHQKLAAASLCTASPCSATV
jgi:hypothetical protein